MLLHSQGSGDECVRGCRWNSLCVAYSRTRAQSLWTVLANGAVPTCRDPEATLNSLMVVRSPMYLSSWRMSPQALRCEVLGRLVALRSRHASDGRDIPHSEKIDQALERAEKRGDLLKCFFPGPLEGQRKVIQAPPDELVRTLHKERPNVAEPASWNLILNASHMYKLSEVQVELAREAVRATEDVSSQDEHSSYLISLELASIVAKINRDGQLANAIAESVTHIAGSISDENDICLILQIYLQAAAALEERDAWFDWLEEKLARLIQRGQGLSVDFDRAGLSVRRRGGVGI